MRTFFTYAEKVNDTPQLVSLLKPNAEMHRRIFLGLLSEFDVKRKFSGKYKTHYHQQPVDLLGYFSIRSGVQFDKYDRCTYENLKTTCYDFTHIALQIPSSGPIWSEIDKESSTNQSIRDVVENCFRRNPLENKD